MQKKRAPALVPPTTGKDLSIIRRDSLYPANRSHCIAVLFDISNPEEAEALHRARAVWQEDSDILALDQDHFILVVRPGGARRLAA